MIDPRPHPVPEIPARPALAGEVPRSAELLGRYACSAGWGVMRTFARGTTLDAHGRPGRVVDCLAVRLARGPIRAVGLWDDGAYSCGLMKVDGMRGVLRLKARQLTALVTAP